MNDSTIPSWFNGVAFAVIAWNIIGVMQYLVHVSISPEVLATMSTAERDLIMNMPDWAVAAFAIAVFTGVLASVLLFIKKSLALQLFLVSLLAVLVQNTYAFFMSNSIEVMGIAAVIVPVVVLTIGVLEIWFCLHAKQNGWIK